MTARINHFAVIVAAVAYFVWGAVWFGVFGSAWRAATGVAMIGVPLTAYIVSFLMGLLLAYAIAVALSDSTKPNMVRHGVEFAIFMSGAFWLTQLLSTSLYEQKPLVLWAIDGFFVVLGSAIMGAIIGGWRKQA